MSRKGHQFSSKGAFLLDNPLRRWLQPSSELLEKLSIAPEDRVVDFGCGPGYYIVETAKAAKSVIGIDSPLKC